MQNFVLIANRANVIGAALLLLIASAAHGSEIYKWVDKDGKTHYSSRKEDAGAAATRTIRADAPPPGDAAVRPAAPTDYQNLIRRKASPEGDDAGSRRDVTQRTAAPNYASETDAAKCQLARDILAGRAKRRNGVPVDAHDRQTAENDVQVFCRK